MIGINDVLIMLLLMLQSGRTFAFTATLFKRNKVE